PARRRDGERENTMSGVVGWWSQSRSFLAQVRNELERVTWPSKTEVYATTFVVILTSVFFGVYLWGIDLLLSSLVGWVFSAFGVA
ncbi:MAG: preprotein translocase subunit SecE, partial [Vicinamibacterales bacterium]|nr:preprotein translocase subunit SecE [Vicinamibacterales bacterium]